MGPKETEKLRMNIILVHLHVLQSKDMPKWATSACTKVTSIILKSRALPMLVLEIDYRKQCFKPES